MAHHNSTPKRILEAPESVPVVVHAVKGPNRRERRFMKIAQVLNTPYEKPVKSDG